MVYTISMKCDYELKAAIVEILEGNHFQTYPRLKELNEIIEAVDIEPVTKNPSESNFEPNKAIPEPKANKMPPYPPYDGPPTI